MNEEVQELLRRVQSTADFGYVTFDSINATNALGDNALHCVCVWGDLQAAKLLVENGINVNQPGERGFTPLKVAVDFGFPEIADYLRANGADPTTLTVQEEFDHDKHALHLQRLGEHIEVLEKRIEQECGDAASGAGFLIHPSTSKAVTMPEVGTKLIFENERVRVWEFTLQPGESIEPHHHDHDYFFYPIEGGTLEVSRASGVTRLTLNAGEVYFRKGGDTHAARNIDNHRYHEVLVELKG